MLDKSEPLVDKKEWEAPLLQELSEVHDLLAEVGVRLGSLSVLASQDPKLAWLEETLSLSQAVTRSGPWRQVSLLMSKLEDMKAHPETA